MDEVESKSDDDMVGEDDSRYNFSEAEFSSWEYNASPVSYKTRRRLPQGSILARARVGKGGDSWISKPGSRARNSAQNEDSHIAKEGQRNACRSVNGT